MKLWVGNYDGRREGLVIAKSKTAAAKVAGCSLYAFNHYWSQTDRVIQMNGAHELEPDTLYTRPYNVYGGTFVKGRCPL